MRLLEAVQELREALAAVPLTDRAAAELALLTAGQLQERPEAREAREAVLLLTLAAAVRRSAAAGLPAALLEAVLRPVLIQARQALAERPQGPMAPAMTRAAAVRLLEGERQEGIREQAAEEQRLLLPVHQVGMER